jgi:3-methylcrotonyl-CoA carboxylase alpha subunit
VAIAVAAAKRCRGARRNCKIDGCAIEARLYAENPNTGFLPCTGPLRHVRLPADIRVDSGIEKGGEVSGFYDPMIAKLIVHAAEPRGRGAGPERRLRRRRSLAGAHQRGVPVPLDRDPAFVAAEIDTGFIERRAQLLIPPGEPGDEVVRGRALALLPADGADPWTGAARISRQCAAHTPGRGRDRRAHPRGNPDRRPLGRAISARAARVAQASTAERLVPSRARHGASDCRASERAAGAGAVSDGALRSPMPGRIVSVAVTKDKRVVKGATILALEAMKMEYSLVAPFDGTSSNWRWPRGDQVPEGMALARIEGDK